MLQKNEEPKFLPNQQVDGLTEAKPEGSFAPVVIKVGNLTITQDNTDNSCALVTLGGTTEYFSCDQLNELRKGFQALIIAVNLARLKRDGYEFV